MDFTNCYEEHLANLEILGRNKGTINNHIFYLNRFFDFLREQGLSEIEEIEPRHIRRYIKATLNRGKEKPITINKSTYILRSFFNFCVEEEIILESKNPIRHIKNLKQEKRVLVTFNDAEVTRIINYYNDNSYTDVRNKTILMALFDMGLRASEVCGIKNSDVTQTGVLIRGKGSKERVVYISPIVRKQMKKYERFRQNRFKKRQPTEYYFLSQHADQIFRSTINKILDTACKYADIRPEVRASPHDCRHYFAQKQLRNGIDPYSLSRLMGHYDTSMTNVYLRGISDADIVERGVQTSPIMDLKGQIKWGNKIKDNRPLLEKKTK